LIRFVQQHERTHRLDGGTKLRFTAKLEKDEQRFTTAQELLEALSRKSPAAGAGAQPRKRK
jgi:transcription-repair coupling factor (superfamily II helicase)